MCLFEDTQNAQEFFSPCELNLKAGAREKVKLTTQTRPGQWRDMKGLQFCGHEFSSNKKTFISAGSFKPCQSASHTSVS